jgi:hypothetical protein
MRGQNLHARIPFAGLTNHNNVEMSAKAGGIAGIDPNDPPDTSLATAIRSLETADSEVLAWGVPDDVAEHFDIQQFNEESPDGTRAFQSVDGGVYIETPRFQAVYSPDKIREYVQNGTYTDDNGMFLDALWNVPTTGYTIINPLDAWEGMETAIRDEGLGDEVFGEIRTYDGGGEMHIDLLFDNYQIEYTDDEDGRDPIVLGIRTGMDFTGSTALYFEGFAQDTRCDNSIRSITEEKVFRHVGEVDLEDAISSILEELGVMTSRLAELIEMAQDIELELLDMEFAEPFDHEDNLRAFYELAGLPSYLAVDAASDSRQRADNPFLPNMTDVWDGATYALTHSYRGGENTTRANELIDTANDFIYNPSLAIGRVSQDHERRMAVGKAEGSDGDSNSKSARANIERLERSTRDLEEEFESRNEQLRKTLVAEADAATDDEDGGTPVEA